MATCIAGVAEKLLANWRFKLIPVDDQKAAAANPTCLDAEIFCITVSLLAMGATTAPIFSTDYPVAVSLATYF
ncbi:uncharacterized protein PADG_11234 [Paracoccidioides brasiliensis Pb18]|uniref:Uncharacterized protein n=1 Tax=Paracoccidioides brasiliensis (strain Pb18) TaxID=502780 RepID=A0A0A0HT85_PARBD|nr:uncharacterized protein PADG_11234 [Paracoccidioides brasiliensis Pb18]KGM92419.1 hypothetical protein PADG_11234 [Paracoccidioides brasiliensis Pb18]ODH47881.1 hypothetical protein GX48_06000 [Paracoccidioides brasiliensis]